MFGPNRTVASIVVLIEAVPATWRWRFSANVRNLGLTVFASYVVSINDPVAEATPRFPESSRAGKFSVPSFLPATPTRGVTRFRAGIMAFRQNGAISW